MFQLIIHIFIKIINRLINVNKTILCKKRILVKAPKIYEWLKVIKNYVSRDFRRVSSREQNHFLTNEKRNEEF